MKLPFKVDLSGETAVITGGGGVLCSGFAKAIAACGANVAIIGRSQDSINSLADEIKSTGGKAIAVVADVLEMETLVKAKQIIDESFGRCTILINGAGGNHPKGNTDKEYYFPEDLDNKDVQTFFDLSTTGMKAVVDLNFHGTFQTIQVFAKDMKKGDVILNISSMNALTPLTKIPAYSAAKAAISNLTQWLAVHFSKVGIRVNAIAPGFFLTSQNQTLLKKEDGSYTDRAYKILGQTPLERFGQPEELIGTVLWLISREGAGFITGTTIPIDGGFSAYSGV